MTDFPRLTSGELVGRFGADEAALRRYRMLAALLREGRPPGEVARTYGVSRESLRRLRHAFAMRGLAALQQRKGGGGHVARGTALATLIQQELNSDSSIASAALWRRVRARLREQGSSAPRSTFYRLLAQMRAEAASESNAQSVSLLREALGGLAEDPPLGLGRSTLATLLLPDLRDPLQRGRMLQQALRAAIKRLRPVEAGPVLDDPRWRHYLIIAGEYEVGEKRAALQGALVLSASTYSRAKREALDRLITLLPDALAELPPPAPPASLIAPPAPSQLYDDEAALDLYATRLRREGLVIIWGSDEQERHDLATSLAARLRARGQKIVWHTCHATDDDTGQSLMLTLAAALALDGHGELWSAIHAPEAPVFPQQLEMLAQGLGARHLTIVLADTQHLHDEARPVLDILLASRAQRDLRLMLVQDTLPPWAAREHWPPLETVAAATASPSLIATHIVRERVTALLTALPLEALPTLNAAQVAQLRTTLEPLDQLIAQILDATHAHPVEQRLS